MFLKYKYIDIKDIKSIMINIMIIKINDVFLLILCFVVENWWIG